MPSLKYRSARTEPLAPFGFGSHKLGGVRLYLYRHIAFGRACGAVEKVLPLHKRNRLRHIIYENGRGGFACPP